MAGHAAAIEDSTFTLSALMLAGLVDEAKAWREWLLRAVAEEFEPGSRRQLGNFPQAFSHVALVNTANNLSERPEPSLARYRE